MDEFMGGNQGSQPGRETSSLRSSTFDMPTTHGAPACEVCGRRDETLRAIVIPYVFSVIVKTMRRTWVGVYLAPSFAAAWGSRFDQRSLWLVGHSLGIYLYAGGAL